MTFEEGRKINLFFGKYFIAKHPDKMTIERLVKNRGRKLYFDYLQMGHGKSIICVYSPRAVACGAVSMPVTWEELKNGVKPCDFTLKNAAHRLKITGDLFAPMLKEGKAVPVLEEILTKSVS
jgi:bifunctional non-homologous end joining protein LigD